MAAQNMKNHLKQGFEVVPILPNEKAEYGPSIPLVLPNDHEYKVATKTIEKIPNVERTSIYVVPEALKLLRSIESPVAIISICGPMRTGKSYILSRLLGEVDAFDLGHTFDPKTFGIWMGTKILKGKDKNGNELAVILLDTEGIDAPGANVSQDASILVLTILISSILIYNSTNVPYKKDLERLDCFVRLAEGFEVKRKAGVEVGEISQYFPHFVWLLRDVSLITCEDEGGKEMDPTDYIKKKVLSRGKGFKASKSDEVGRAIITFFPDIECKTLPSPHSDSKVMQNIVNHTNDLNPKFMEGVQQFMEKLISKVHTNGAKRGYQKGSLITGTLLCGLLEEYVKAVNDPNSIPCLDNAWQNTVDLLRNKAMDELVEKYSTTMTAKFDAASKQNGIDHPLEENKTSGNSSYRGVTLMGMHDEILKSLTKELLEKVAHFGAADMKGLKENSQELVDAFQIKIIKVKAKKGFTTDAKGQKVEYEGMEVCGGVLLKFISKNKAMSVDFCTKLYNELFAPILLKIENDSEKYTFQQLEQDFMKLNAEYIKRAIGPEKWHVLSDMDKKTAETQKVNFKKVKGYQEKVMQEKRRAKELENEAKERQEEVKKLHLESRREREKNAENLNNMQTKFQQQMEKLKEEEQVRRREEMEKMQDLQKTNFADFQGMIKEFNQTQKSNLQTMMENLNQERQQSQKQMTELVDAMKNMPPPQVVVEKSGLCSVM